MKNRLLTLLFLLTSTTFLFAQTPKATQAFVLGDWRTASSDAPWDELIAGFGGNLSWEKYDGSSWVAADNSSDYPTSIDHTVYINNPGITIISDAITINSGGKIVIAAGADLYDGGKLTNNAGTGGIVVEASSSAAGQYKNKTDIQATISYYLSASSWHLIGSPFSGYSTSTMFTGAYMQQFDDSDADNWIWNDEAGYSASMTVGYGYSYWKSSAETYTFSGTADGDDVVLSGLPYLDQGYVLLANPYTSAVKYTTDWTLTNVADGIDIWGKLGGSYSHFEAADNEAIPLGTGFFMRTTATGSVTIAEADRITTTTTNPYKSTTDSPQKYVRLLIENTNNNMADMLKLKFADGSNTNFDITIDGKKMYGSEESPDFFIRSEDGIAASIKGISPVDVSTVKLQLKPNVDATYRISASEYEFDPTTEVLLEDLFTSQVMTVDENLNYTFTSTAADTEDRFRIYVTPSANGIEAPNLDNQFKIFGNDNQIHILSENTDYQLNVYNLLGQKLLEKTNLRGNTNFDLSSYKQKIIIVSLRSKEGVISKKIQLR